MYSPHSDLEKMTYTPSFIVFKVLIENKEYYGRVDTLRIEHPFIDSNKKSGKFNIYDSVESFKRGYIIDTIDVTHNSLVGIEAIDIVDPEPLNRILSTCYEIESIQNSADIGIVMRSIPDILNRLMKAMDDYEVLHNCKKYETAYYEIEELASQCKNITTTTSEQQRADLINHTKERVGNNIYHLIRLSGN